MHALFDRGYRCLIRYPLSRGKHVDASITLFSKRENAFDLESLRVKLGDLPIDKALLAALALDDVDQLKARVKLIQQISACTDQGQAASRIVRWICDHYGWEHISIFRVVSGSNAKIALLAQAAASGVTPLSPDYESPVDKGVIGALLADNRRSYIHIPDLRVGDPPNSKYVRGAFEARSELCLRIEIDKRTWGVLNIEDSRISAFTEEEIQAIQNIVEEATTFLRQLEQAEINRIMFESTPHPLFVVDEGGQITRANVAAEQLLSLDGKRICRSALKTFVLEKEVLAELLQPGIATNADLTILRSTGDEIAVAAECTALGSTFTGKIVSLKDLRQQQQRDKAKSLEQTVFEVAAQTKVPLSLAATWLRQLRSKLTATDTSLDTPDALREKQVRAAELLDRTIAQLRKAEITYELLAHQGGGFDIHVTPLVIDVRQFLIDIVREWPHGDSHKLCPEVSISEAYVEADPVHLSFAVQAALLYAVSAVPENCKVSLSVVQKRNRISFAIASMEAFTDVAQRSMVARRDRATVQLVRPTIERLINLNGGKMRWVEHRERGLNLQFEFPMRASTHG
jgi:PAS domain-containing protein